MTFSDPHGPLTDSILEDIRSRASRVDAENVFPEDDLDQLRAIGYLRQLIPARLGGGGATLVDTVEAQERLAGAAPATALSVNMHLVVSGIVRYLNARGDHRADWIGAEISGGEVYALGISEPGNDAVMLDSTVRFDPDGAGGGTFTGVKVFTSLSPVWTRLWVFGRDDSGPEPRLVHAVVHRDDLGVDVRDDWDTVGMRGTRSCTTTLENVAVPADRIIGTIPVGPSAEPLLAAIFANFLVLVASVYVGIGERAAQLAADAVIRRTSRVADGAALAEDASVRDALGRLGVRQLASAALVRATAADVDDLRDLGDSAFPRYMTAKLTATTTARRVVDEAMSLVGGSSYRSAAELGRLYRDVAAGHFHPSHDRNVRQSVANLLIRSAETRSARAQPTTR